VRKKYSDDENDTTRHLDLGRSYDLLQAFPEDFFQNGSQDREDSPPQERGDLE
jgi:hypothetical protein